MSRRKSIQSLVACGVLSLLSFACSTVDDPSKKDSNLGLVATPPSYYSTPKARYLANKYKNNLNRLVEEIVRHPATASLQFSNNITSVGGIGFFTHSAVKSPDERYLEVILGTPETFETQGDYSAKVARLFSIYGSTLLTILGGDAKILAEAEVSGYGLNFSWRTIITIPSTRRVAMERAVLYLDKSAVRGFLRKEKTQNELLKDAVIFGVADDGPMRLVSYQAEEAKPDYRPAIQEADLSNRPSSTEETKPAMQQAVPEPQVKSTPTTAIKPRPLEVPIADARNIPDPRLSRELNQEIEQTPTDTTVQSLSKPAVPVELSKKPADVETLKMASKGQIEPPAAAPTSDDSMTESQQLPVAPGPVPVETVRVEKVEPSMPTPPTTVKEVEPVDLESPNKIGARAAPIAGDEQVLPIQAKAEMSMPQEKTPVAEIVSEVSKKVTVENPGVVVSAPKQVIASAPPPPVITPQPIEKIPLEDGRASTGIHEAAGAASIPVKKVEPIAQEPKNVLPPEPLPTVTARLPRMHPDSEQAKPAPIIAKAEVSRYQPPPETVVAEPAEPMPVASQPSIAPPPNPVPQIRTPAMPILKQGPKALEGYIIQLGFADRNKAQDWAEKFLSQGFAVSFTESGSGAIRVRLGNFSVRDEAEVKLRSLQRDGLKGIIVNLPLRYQPAVSASQP